MATPAKNIEGFYKQKKSNTSKSKSTKHAAATSGSNIVQPPALVSHGGSFDLKDDFDEEEQVLRLFDMNMAFGPCIAIPRLDRWERAQRLGLNPPKEIESILKRGKVNPQSLFDGRI
ncbi:pentatricopeptide repeat-containing protein [Hibiscus syriacus]|uniref:Pentatricopeptide repeat-containing protein n=1 Tax=Hibiscus syriacus TaxID=106335 RepID=A0A6A3AEU7_HIBSY|nr:DNA polymerase delta subunit 4-like isoform X2 [Hibiscus syriacus]KAE8702333.1 pentatricopeptide repeat-containing protein [Hibiscus syriacus]